MNITVHKRVEEAPITFTEAAREHLLIYLDKNKEQHKGVRLSVKKTGCSGYAYVVDYVISPLEGDIVASLSKDYLVCIDSISYPLLKNMQVDYIKQGLNFKFVFSNPNQTGQCGCGESFSVTR